MAQVNMNAWQQGSQMYRDSLDRERQAQLDAMAAKRFGWEEDKVNRERATYDETQRIGRTQRDALFSEQPAATPYGDNGYLAKEAPDAQFGPPASVANPAIQNATTTSANPMDNNLAQGLKVGMDRLAQQRQMAMSAYDMALANNDRQGMLAASGAIQQLQTAAQRASIFNTVLANPDTVRQVANNLTNNSAIALKATVNDAGITVLSRDDGYKAELKPYDMARLAVHMWDLKNGDASAIDKIGEINKELAASIKESNGMTATLAESSNKGLKLGADLRSTEANIRQSDASAEASRASAERSRAITTRELEDPVQRKIAFMEAAGVPVSPEMRKELYGIKANKYSDESFIQDLAKEIVKNDPTQAEKLPEIMDKLRRGFSATKLLPKAEAAVAKAAAEGKLPEARADWIKRGEDPAQFDTLVARIGNGTPLQSEVTTKIPKNLQSQRDEERRLILMRDLEKAQKEAADGNPRAPGDVAALTRELAAMGGAPAPQTTTSPPKVAPPVQTERMPPPQIQRGNAMPPEAQPRRTLSQELGATGDGGIFDRQAESKALALQQAVENVLRARGQLRAAAASGDPRAAQMYAQEAQEAKNAYDDLVRSMNMNPQMEARVRNSAGM